MKNHLKNSLLISSLATLLAIPAVGQIMMPGADAFIGAAVGQPDAAPAGDGCGTGNLVFSWHMEDLTVTTGTPAGCSQGDTTGTLNSGAYLTNYVAQDGTYSLRCPSSADYCSFSVSSDDIFNDDAGTFTIYINVGTWLDGLYIATLLGDTTNRVQIRTDGTDVDGSRHVEMLLDFNGAAQLSITTTGTGLSLNTWHKVTAKWRTGTTDPTTSSSLQIDTQTAVTGTTPLASWNTQATELRIGGGVNSGLIYVDNMRVYNAWLP